MSEHIRAATQPLRALKAQVSEPWVSILQRTFLGLLFFGGGIAVVVFLKAPWWVAVIGGTVGAHIWKAELINTTLQTLPKLVAAAIRDVLNALRGKE